MTIKQIFLDMDGTLLNEQGTVSDDNRRTVADSVCSVTLVSARAPMEMQATIQQLALTAPQIAFNGGLIFDPQTRKTLVRHALDPKLSSNILTILAQKFPQVSVSCYDQADWYVERVDGGILHEQALTRQTPIVIQQTLAQFAQTHSLFKLMLIVDDTQTMQALKCQLDQFTGVINCQQAGNQYLEITSLRAQKAQGIVTLLESSELTLAEAAAFGDGHNDLPMLKVVGRSIAMGNAAPEMKAASQFVTLSNEDDGVAYGIKHYLD